jgi:glyoxylase-like metal-dependent hydrolase (beta-lactamase superfamily II)
VSWTRRDFIVTSAVGTLGTLWRAPSWAGQGQPPPQAKFEMLRRNVGTFFSGRGGTTGWLISPDALVVVDTQFPDSAKACIDGLKQRTQRQVDLLFNTHHHGDHIAGNGVFRPLTKKIVTHARFVELQKAAAASSKNPLPHTEPDATLTTTWQQQVGDETVAAKHYGSAHTGGDIVITFEKANVVHMGDLMFHRLHPFVDRGAGASIRGWMDQLGKIAAEHAKDTIYIFGHAKPELPVTGSSGDLAQMQKYFAAVVEHTEKAIKAGKSRDEHTAMKPLPGFEDYAEWPPILSLASVLGVAYDELSASA